LPFRNQKELLGDILESITLIERFVAGANFETYCTDPKTSSAVERQMQILTEAAKNLGVDAETLCPGPDWKGFRGMGDLLRHAYHRIDDEIIWDTITLELPPLKIAVEKALATILGG